MPRIDPQQVLNCLQFLLAPGGGILSKDEVKRLAILMTKFSKKLVSKCIYVLILKNTDKQLLGSFMGEGGWNLIHIWLQDAHLNKNWALVTEVLQLLLITPVDVEQLKRDNLPKLVKSLTKREDLPSIQQLASSLVEEWLKIVNDVTKTEAMVNAQLPIENKPVEMIQVVQEVEEASLETDEETNKENNTISENSDNTLRFKVALKDGIQVISKIVPTGEDHIVPVSSNVESTKETTEADKKDDKRKEKLNHDRNKHRSSSASSKSGSSRDSSKDKIKSSSSTKSSSSKDKDRRDRDRHRSNGSSSKSRSSSSTKPGSKGKKESEEKQAEKDKDTLAKIEPPTLQKIGRIPKKPEDKKSSTSSTTKKPTFSVEVRKSNEEKPKTVKVFNSKMRSTGLLEEAKPPPPRTAPKKPAAPLPSVIPVTRPSPIRDLIPPPEKKSRLLDPPIPDRPGVIRLILPKPKRKLYANCYLLEFLFYRFLVVDFGVSWL